MMDSQRYERVKEIFTEIVDKSPEDRPALLDRLCAGDPELKATVARMLDQDASGASLLDGGLGEVLPGLLDDGPDTLPKQLFGPYRIVRLLGEGGMGVVYLAEREDLGSRAAIKILRDSTLSPMRRQRFAIEQKMLAQLNHPSIARLYDADTLEDGTPYIVMEYVEGVPLSTYLQDHPQSLEQMLGLYRSICEAVRYAHSQAILHRDLKPSNILVTRDGAVKLVDFGIGKQLPIGPEPGGQTITAFRLMTPAYSAPEQIRGAAVGVQADVYSLGVVLYELLARRLPFDLSNQSPGQIERTIEQGEPKPPSTFGKQEGSGSWRVPALGWSELDTLCLTAMHKDPDRRYQSVEALTRDLDHYLKGEPLEARPDSLRYRASKFVGRNRRALAWATIVALVVAALAGFSALRIAKARRETAVEAARTQQIQQFMLNLFNGGDSGAGPSEDLRVTTLLDRGVQQARALDRDPETQAELYQTLAGIYQDLGKFDRAEPLLQSALDLRKRVHGPESPEAADTMTAMGLLRLAQAKPAEAETLTRTALAIDRRRLPPTDPATAKATSALGRVLEENGSSAEAVPLLQQAVKLQSGRPELAPDLAISTAALATANYYTGQFATADALNRQALALDEKVYGPFHPRVADDFVNLGEIQHELGHEAEAEKLYRQALAIKKDWYGEKHPDTAFCMMAVGQSLIYQKRYDDAAPFIQGGLAVQEEVFGPSHPRVAMAYNQAGLLEQRRGHLDAAAHDFTRMAEINRAVYGDRHYLVGVAMMNLGQVYLDGKKYNIAEESFQGALERFREKLPADHPYIAIDEQKLGTVLVLERKYKDAETPLLDADRMFAKQTPPPAERLASTRRDLATVYEQLGQPDKAATFRDQMPAATGAPSAARQ
jgi:serine/threonine-protein kinase